MIVSAVFLLVYSSRAWASREMMGYGASKGNGSIAVVYFGQTNRISYDPQPISTNGFYWTEGLGKLSLLCYATLSIPAWHNVSVVWAVSASSTAGVLLFLRL